MRFLEWVLIQYDCCPYKRKFGHSHVQEKHHAKTQGENSHLQAQEGHLRRNQPCCILILGFQPTEL